jgi:integrase
MKEPKHYSRSSGEDALTQEELDKVLKITPTDEDRLLIMIGVSLGLRRTDLVGIRRENINTADGTLAYVEKKKKNKLLIRPIPDTLKNELERYLKDKPKYGPLFEFCDRTAWNRFNKMCDLAGIKRRPIHALRSTCIKLHQKMGWSESQTAKLIDDTVSTVQAHYSTPTQEELSKMMKEKSVI